MLASAKIVVPARRGSTRLPLKMLADLGGEPLIVRTWRRAAAASPGEVIVATDDRDIAEACARAGARCEMTSADHASGTDRIAEVASSLDWGPDQIVINLQGDEPFMPAANLQAVVHALEKDARADVATLVEPLSDAEDFHNPAVVKVVRGADDGALYFSRAPIPYPRDDRRQVPPACALRHLGLYAYRVRALAAMAAAPPSPAEQAEGLEQLRALELGLRIVAADAPVSVPPGIDTAADLEAARRRFNES